MEYLIVANWKMNMTLPELRNYVAAIKQAEILKKRVVAIAPPFTLLFPLFHMLEGTDFKIAAQNMFFEEKGAFTGEVSPKHLLDAHVDYVIIGHSERRKIFSEDDITIAKKLKAAIKNNLKPIFCVGETLEERQSNKTFDVILSQVDVGLSLLNQNDIEKVTFAYEPVWAIGTGLNATPEQAEEVHLAIKEFLQKKYFKSLAQSVKILYGGSVTPDNVSSLMSMPDINGALVGGASLKPESFLQIINFKELK